MKCFLWNALGYWVVGSLQARRERWYSRLNDAPSNMPNSWFPKPVKHIPFQGKKGFADMTHRRISRWEISLVSTGSSQGSLWQEGRFGDRGNVTKEEETQREVKEMWMWQATGFEGKRATEDFSPPELWDNKRYDFKSLCLWWWLQQQWKTDTKGILLILEMHDDRAQV